MVYLVVAEVISLQTFNFLSFRSGITIDNTLVSFVCYFLADVILVVCNKNALAVASIFGIQLHCGMESSARACKKV